MSEPTGDDVVTSADVALPTVDDPMLTDATEGLGGRMGHHARLMVGWWSPLRVTLLALGVSLAVAYLLKAPCRDAAVWQDQYQFTHLCYTDTLASFTAYGLDAGQWPYVGFDTPYPPLIGVFMAAAAVLAKAVPFGAAGVAYWNVTVIMLAACACVLVVSTAALAGRRRPWDAMMLALSPVLVLHAFTNWDLLPAALLGMAMWAWARRSPPWAGVWLGLAVAAKGYPLVLLVVLLLLCLRAHRMRDWWAIAATTLGTLVAVVLPVRLLAPEGFGAFWATNAERGPDWDSIWLPLSELFRWSTDAAPTNARVAVASLLVLLAVIALVAAAPRRPRVAAIFFVLLAGLLLVGKVFSPHDALWLTPLAVLARPRWRAFLAWQCGEVMLVPARMFLLVGRENADRGLPVGWWYTAVAVRDIVLLVLVAFVVRDVLRPELDVVRADGTDDPAGGVLTDAPEPDDRRRPDDDAWLFGDEPVTGVRG